jgi:hypothetical protein
VQHLEGKKGSFHVFLPFLPPKKLSMFVTTTRPALSADSITEQNQSSSHEHFLSGSNHLTPPTSILIIFCTNRPSFFYMKSSLFAGDF